MKQVPFFTIARSVGNVWDISRGFGLKSDIHSRGKESNVKSAPIVMNVVELTMLQRDLHISLPGAKRRS